MVWWVTGEHVQERLEAILWFSGQKGSMMLIFKNEEQKPAKHQFLHKYPEKNEAVNKQTIYKHLEDNHHFTVNIHLSRTNHVKLI